jgi:hypothetical protein
MFDLNQELTKWRDSLAESEALSVSAIDELENHLREEIESLVSRDLSEEEAFWLARRRLGGACDLVGEFAKINKSVVLRARLFWMVAGALTYILAMQSGLAASKLSVLLGALGGLRGHGLGFVGIAGQTLVLAVVIYLCYRVCRRISISPAFSLWADGITGRNILFATLAVLIVLIFADRVCTIPMARFMSNEAYGQIVLDLAYTQLVLNLLLPLVMVVMIVLLRRSTSAGPERNS